MIGYSQNQNTYNGAIPNILQTLQFQHYIFQLFNNTEFSSIIRPQIRSQQQQQMIIEDDRQNQMSFSLNTQEPQLSLLNVDELIQQGRMYDQESSSSSNKQVQTRSQKNKGKLMKQEEKIVKTKKKIQQIVQKEKQIQIGSKKQQLEFKASSIKPRTIRIHQHNEEKFQQLYEKLQLLNPNCNDWDVISLLELSYNNFDRAFKLLEESENFVLYFLQVKRQQNQELQDNIEVQSIGKKK